MGDNDLIQVYSVPACPDYGVTADTVSSRVPPALSFLSSSVGTDTFVNGSETKTQTEILTNLDDGMTGYLTYDHPTALFGRRPINQSANATRGPCFVAIYKKGARDFVIEFYTTPPGRDTKNDYIIGGGPFSAATILATAVNAVDYPSEGITVLSAKLTSASPIPIRGNTPPTAVPLCALVFEFVVIANGDTSNVRTVYVPALFPIGFAVFDRRSPSQGGTNNPPPGLDANNSNPVDSEVGTVSSENDPVLSDSLRPTPDGYGSGGISGMSARFNPEGMVTCVVAIADAILGIVHVSLLSSSPLVAGNFASWGNPIVRRANVGQIKLRDVSANPTATAVISCQSATSDNTIVVVCAGDRLYSDSFWSAPTKRVAMATRIETYLRTSTLPSKNCEYQPQTPLNVSESGNVAILDAKISASGTCLCVLSHPFFVSTLDGTAAFVGLGNVDVQSTMTVYVISRDWNEPSSSSHLYKWVSTGVFQINVAGLSFMGVPRGDVLPYPCAEVLSSPARVSFFSLSWSGRTIFCLEAAADGAAIVTMRQYTRRSTLESTIAALGSSSGSAAVSDTLKKYVQAVAPTLVINESKPAPLLELSPPVTIQTLPPPPQRQVPGYISWKGAPAHGVTSMDYFGTGVCVHQRNHYYFTGYTNQQAEELFNLAQDIGTAIYVMLANFVLNVPVPSVENPASLTAGAIETAISDNTPPLLDNPNSNLPRPVPSPIGSLSLTLPKDPTVGVTMDPAVAVRSSSDVSKVVNALVAYVITGGGAAAAPTPTDILAQIARAPVPTTI